MPKDIPTKHPIRKQTFNPKKARNGEVIGGGYIVLRRGDDTGRVRPPLWPYEHGTYDEAKAEANKLAAAQPGALFQVFAVLHSAQVSA
jgi:hypothetical protein